MSKFKRLQKNSLKAIGRPSLTISVLQKKINYHSLGYVTRVVYLCFCLLQLAAVSRDLSQAEIEITILKPE